MLLSVRLREWKRKWKRKREHVRERERRKEGDEGKYATTATEARPNFDSNPAVDVCIYRLVEIELWI